MARPLLFKTVEELEDKIDDFYEFCIKENRPLTISRLAVFLGCDRDTILNYSKKDAFFGTIKKVKVECEAYAHESLYRNTQVAGTIFNLKNNYNWKDKTETDITSKGEMISLLSNVSAIGKQTGDNSDEEVDGDGKED